MAVESVLEKPDWLKVKAGTGDSFPHVRATLSALNVRAVCDSSHCPNIGDCWSRGTATFMILGRICTRGCGFCTVGTGPKGDEPDPSEPGRIAKAVATLGIEHVVITSVTRDDLDDHGSRAYSRTVESIRESSPGCSIELLIPDMGGSLKAISHVLSSRPDVLGHNVETVERLTPLVRHPRASYATSLEVLSKAKESDPSVITKSSLMLGLGETWEEVVHTLRDIKGTGVDIVTIGQYLRPGKSQVPIARYIPPSEFDELGRLAREMGFAHVSSGPFVRSSYKAKEAFIGIRRRE